MWESITATQGATQRVYESIMPTQGAKLKHASPSPPLKEPHKAGGNPLAHLKGPHSIVGVHQLNFSTESWLSHTLRLLHLHYRPVSAESRRTPNRLGTVWGCYCNEPRPVPVVNPLHPNSRGHTEAWESITATGGATTKRGHPSQGAAPWEPVREVRMHCVTTSARRAQACYLKGPKVGNGYIMPSRGYPTLIPGDEIRSGKQRGAKLFTVFSVQISLPSAVHVSPLVRQAVSLTVSGQVSRQTETHSLGFFSGRLGFKQRVEHAMSDQATVQQ